MILIGVAGLAVAALALRETVRLVTCFVERDDEIEEP